MAEENKKQNGAYKRFLLFVIGSVVLLGGITLILHWWDALVILCKGSIGFVLALSGMFMLYAASKL
ncbi:MAG: hypothetical protein HQL25_04070 [Candidatus Omnitrophica bacterium]|nr:hypothetical protein [Candidatus Omnitrophota bacterium]